MEPLTQILLAGAAVALFIAGRVAVNQFLRIRKSDNITFIKGDNKITITPDDKNKSKKLMHL